MEDHQLLQPLLPINTTITISNGATSSGSSSSCSTISSAVEDHQNKTVSSNWSIILRLVTIISIGVISLWANYEAAKGLGITIINDIKDTQASKRFTLLYVSNDKVIRMVQKSSSIVENILYPNPNSQKKKVSHVTLHLVSTNETNLINVITDHQFSINISPSSIMMDQNKDLDSEITSMILQGMSRIWMWNGNPTAPSWLLDGLVEYIKKTAGFAYANGPSKLPHFDRIYLEDKEAEQVAEFLDNCEKVSKGFIQRLNESLKDGWHNFTVEDALGIQGKNLSPYFGNSYTDFSISS